MNLTRASNAHRRIRCPGSGWAEHGLTSVDSDISREGTKLHAALHDPDTLAGLDPAQADLVRLCDELRQEAITKARFAFNIPESAEYQEMWEQEVNVRKGIRPILTGHIDYSRLYREHNLVVIFDAKYGFIETMPAPLNVQLLCYAIGAWQEFDNVENVVVAIGQPRAMLDEGSHRLSIAVYDVDALRAGLAALLIWEKAWMDPEAPRIPSESACKYCTAQLTCPERIARMEDLPAVSVRLRPSIGDMPVEDFAKLYDGFRIASNEAVAAMIKEEAIKRCEEGRLPGYRIEEGNVRRTVTDSEKAFNILADTDDGLLSCDEYAACSSLTLGELEKLLRAKFKITAKKAKALVNEKLDSVIEKKQAAPSIVAVDPETEAAKRLL